MQFQTASGATAAQIHTVLNLQGNGFSSGGGGGSDDGQGAVGTGTQRFANFSMGGGTELFSNIGKKVGTYNVKYTGLGACVDVYFSVVDRFSNVEVLSYIVVDLILTFCPAYICSVTQFNPTPYPICDV